MNNELTVDGAGNYNKQTLRRRPDLKQATWGENIVHDSIREYDTLRPIRNLPSLFTKGNNVDSEGYVFSQGTVLGKYDAQLFNADAGGGAAWQHQFHAPLGVDDPTLGRLKLGVNDIAIPGNFHPAIDVDGNLVTAPSNDPVWGDSIDITGFVGPMNGTNKDQQDGFSAKDSAFDIVDPVTGAVIDDAFINGANLATFREAGDATDGTFELVGVAKADTMRETRNSHWNYRRDTEAITVVKQGYLTLPFVIADANTYTFETAAAAAALTSNVRAYSGAQTFLVVEDAKELQTGAAVMIDAWGNPALPSASVANYPIGFGTITNFTFSTKVPMAELVNSVPSLELTGSGTAGVAGDIFQLGRKMKPTDSVADVAALITDNYLFGYATIYFNIP